MKVYIDGENCRKGLTRVLKEEGAITNPRHMESYRLTDLLKDILGVEELEINYYASVIKLPYGYTPSEEVMNHVERIKAYNRKWVPALQAQDITYTKAGTLKVRSSKECRSCGEVQDILQEKGVDVRIATDMLEAAYSGNEKSLALLSSDTDLCPAIHKIKAKGTKVIYIGFADSINRAVSAVADQTITISIPKTVKYLSEEDSDNSAN